MPDQAPLSHAAAERPTQSAADHDVRAKIRFYCQGIGDCHLLRFPTTKGGFFNVLIDCGIHSSVTGGADTIDNVVEDIAKVTEGRLDVIVLTHEHWDHVSGFHSARQKFSDEKKFTVGEIWMAWTENPEDPQAKEFDRYKRAAGDAIKLASEKLSNMQGVGEHLSTLQTGLKQLLGFTFAAKGDRVRSARDALVGLLQGKTKPRYLEPKSDPQKIEDVPDLRVYVLGPPRKTELFGITERGSEMYQMGPGTDSMAVRALRDPFAISDRTMSPENDVTAPFDSNEGFCLSYLLTKNGDPAKAQESGLSKEDRKERKRAGGFLEKFYAGPARGPRVTGEDRSTEKGPRDQSWRRIDGDWLGVSADLAIQLDKRTNNSSLVLAFEFVDSGRVMLFVGDAQAGNWLSWKDVGWQVDGKSVTAHDLLARTVFYKVGHHGSHNATLKQKGLELMVHPDLSAFIPTNEQDACSVGWKQMPFKTLLTALGERSAGRVIRADDPWLMRGEPAPFKVSGAIKDVRQHPKGLWVELDIA